MVEQLIATFWLRDVVEPTLAADPNAARRVQLSDTRTWTASVRSDVLFQKGIIQLDTLTALSVARQARNDFYHTGRHPSQEDARASYDAVAGLLVTAFGVPRPPLLDLDLEDHSLSDAFAPPKGFDEEPRYRLPITKLPGEVEFERKKFEVMARRSGSGDATLDRRLMLAQVAEARGI